MGYEFIPDEVREFVLSKIDSVAQLEALLLMRRESGVTWTPLALAQRLYVNEKQTADLLNQLCSDGFIVVKSARPVSYQYQPHNEELEKICDKLDDAYSRYLVPVTNLIHGKSRFRVQEFADAFKFRKDD